MHTGMSYSCQSAYVLALTDNRVKIYKDTIKYTRGDNSCLVTMLGRRVVLDSWLDQLLILHVVTTEKWNLILVGPKE